MKDVTSPPVGTLEPGERIGKFRLSKDDLIVDADK